MNKDLVWGIGLLAIGGIVTLATYTSAQGGGTHFVMWGLMAYGGFRLIKGLLGGR